MQYRDSQSIRRRLINRLIVIDQLDPPSELTPVDERDSH